MYQLELVRAATTGEVVYSAVDSEGIGIELVRYSGRLEIGAGDLRIRLPEAVQSANVVDRLGEEYLLARKELSADDVLSAGANAWIVSRSGSVEREFSLGRGFHQVLTDGRRCIWTSYWDDVGLWAPPEGAAASAGVRNGPYLMPGAVRWREPGVFDWVLSEMAGFDPAALHCHVLNCTGETVLFGVDQGNSVVLLDKSGDVVSYPSPVQGPSGIAISGSTVRFLGRYEPQERRGAPVRGFDVVTTAGIKGGQLVVTDVGSAVMPDGSAFPRPPRGVVSRGGAITMHFGDPGKLYRLAM